MVTVDVQIADTVGWYKHTWGKDQDGPQVKTGL
jgi:hypothetical protein